LRALQTGQNPSQTATFNDLQRLSPPPGLGAHSDAILAELGLDAAALRAVGAVR